MEVTEGETVSAITSEPNVPENLDKIKADEPSAENSKAEEAELEIQDDLKEASIQHLCQIQLQLIWRFPATSTVEATRHIRWMACRAQLYVEILNEIRFYTLANEIQFFFFKEIILKLPNVR